MKEHAIYVYAAILALVVCAVFGFGVGSRSRDFNRTVKKALATSVNYDQSFISMVDRLEMELATRASFGYEGGKDPMTGLFRQVVARPLVTAAPIKVTADSVPVDPIRLTAIIYDNESRIYNAVVMDKERSFSVVVGDRVSDRVIKAITEEAIIMEKDSLIYRYDIYGRSAVRKKLPSGQN